MKYSMDCGCEFNIIKDGINPITGLPYINIDFYNLRLDCPNTWDIFIKSTKGVFQLETPLGQAWSRKLKPRNIEELAALISLLRPGCLKAVSEGKSLTQHFVDRKNKEEEVVPVDESISDILANTYQVMTYQEQTLQIAQKIAGFDLKQADVLRRAIGKKIPELMTKVESEFLEGIKKTGIVSEEKGKIIWDNIRKSERYNFNACLSPETIVETPASFKQLSEIQIGEIILAPKDDDSGDEFVKVTNKFNNGKKEVFEVKLESNKKIICSIDHEFLCEDGEIRPLWQIFEENHKIFCEND